MLKHTDPPGLSAGSKIRIFKACVWLDRRAHVELRSGMQLGYHKFALDDTPGGNKGGTIIILPRSIDDWIWCVKIDQKGNDSDKDI